MPVHVLFLTLSKPECSLNDDGEGDDYAAMGFAARLTWPEDLVDKDGKALIGRVWRVSICDKASSSPFAAPSGALGTVRLLPESAARSQAMAVAEFLLKATHFSRLLSSWHAGLESAQLELTVRQEDQIDSADTLIITGACLSIELAAAKDRTGS